MCAQLCTYAYTCIRAYTYKCACTCRRFYGLLRNFVIGGLLLRRLGVSEHLLLAFFEALAFPVPDVLAIRFDMLG